ncbi:MAG: glycosyltransferase family 2 protein [Bryobacteraceae bacterium]
MSATQHILAPRPEPSLVSLVIPIYNEEAVIPLLLDRLAELIAHAPFSLEVVFVNDGSSDHSLHLLHQAAQRTSNFRVLALARNFGHQIAATAGLDAARGEAVILMDADLQDPPEIVPEMVRVYREGYDVVAARRITREGESAFKRFTAWLFYRTMRALIYKDLPPDVGDFRLLSRRFLDALGRMRETHRFLRGMTSWLGFPQTTVPFVRALRAAGETKYPLAKMLRFAWTAAISFSPLPLRLSFSIGWILLGFGICYTFYALVEMALGMPLVRGWMSLVVVNCLGSGAIMVAIGVLGEYVGRIFEESKGRPLYIVADEYALPSPDRQASPSQVL